MWSFSNRVSKAHFEPESTEQHKNLLQKPLTFRGFALLGQTINYSGTNV
jgi:hypothetical protein